MEHFLPKARVLITVKTYPLPSRKYDELVCTAGLLDGERWIRIYPVPYRELTRDQQFKKWDWIELDLERRHSKDARVESYQPRRGVDEPIRILDSMDLTRKGGWDRRRSVLLKNVHTSMEPLIRTAKEQMLSLAVVKPTRILEVHWEDEPERWNELDKQGMLDLVPTSESRSKIKPVRPIPFRFSYVFTTKDGKTRTMMVEDWEIGALYWNCLTDEGGPDVAREKVIQKLESLMNTTDLHFIVGTTLANHVRAPNPFVIIGLFYPPFEQSFGQLDWSF